MKKETKHKKDNCTANDMNYNGHCFNCGINTPKHKRANKKVRIEILKMLGFEFPE